jgi:hypothetical protein
MEKSAVFSPCRRYRYALWRTWSPLDLSGKGYAMFIGLNPSTADEENDDPTVRRCIAFAKSWGFDGLCMTNLFAYRSTDPVVMLAQDDPIGPDNDRTLTDLGIAAGVVVAAWGVRGVHRGRGEAVRRMLPNIHYLRLTRDGHPGHPLYLPKTLMPHPWD